MPDINEKIKSGATFLKDKDYAVFKEIQGANEKLEQLIEEVKKKSEETLEIAIDPEEIRGPQGIQGIPGTPGKDAILPPNLKEDIFLDVLSQMPTPEELKGLPGSNGSPDTGEEIIAKINDVSPDGLKIDAAHISNLPRSVERIIETGGFRVGASETPIKAGSNVSVRKDAQGAYVISADNQTTLPAGLDTQVQFNDGGVFGGDAGFVYNKANDTLTLTGSADAQRLILKAHSSQTANLQEWQNSTGTLKTSITAAGDILSQTSTTFQITANQGMSLASVNNIVGIVTAGSYKFVVNNDGTTAIGTNYLGVAATQLSIQPAAASNIGLVIQGASSQSANLQEWQDSSNTVLLAVGANGYIYQGTHLLLHTTGTANTFVGKDAGNLTLSGLANTGLGELALNAITSGNVNTAFGYASLQVNTAGTGNSGFGSGTLVANTTGNYNTAFGYGALVTNVSGFHNLGIGLSALNSNVSGNFNVSVGNNALFYTTASNNTAIGYAAGLTNTTGTNNTFVGYTADAGSNNLTNATAIGSGAMVGATGNVAIGYGASASDTNGTAIGFLATSVGQQTLAIGTSATASNTGGNFGATAIGYGANATGGVASAFGNGAQATSTGDIAIGYGANASGGNAFALGRQSAAAFGSSMAFGFFAQTTAANQFVIGGSTGGFKITDGYFGPVVDTSPSDFSINTSGGSGSNVAGASLTIAAGKATGNAAGGALIFSTSDAGASGSTLQSLTEKMRITATGNVGIGSTNPGAKLEVIGIIRGNNGFNDLVLQDGAGNQAFRSVNAAGWTDSATTQFSQVGAFSGNMAYTAASGSTAGRLQFSSSATQITAGSYNTTPVPIGIFEVLDSAQNNRFTILSGGNVGIGTTVPGALLHVGLAGTTLGTFRLAGNTSGYVQLQPAAAAGSVTFTLPAAQPTIAGQALVATTGGVMSWSNILPTATTVSLTGQTADIGSTNFSNTSTAGLYRVSYTLEDTTADLTAGAVTVTIAYTDTAGAATQASAAQVLTGVGRVQGSVFIQLASGSISYSTTHTGLFGTATYALYMTVEKLL